MRLMLVVKRTIQGTKRELTFLIVQAVLLILVYNLYMDKVIIIYPFLLSAAIMLVYFVTKGIMLSGFYRRLERASDPIHISHYDDDLQARVFRTIASIQKNNFDQITKLQLQMKTRNDLFSQFIHGLKSSASIIDLALNKFDVVEATNTALLDIYIENEKLKKNLEQSLNILRLDTFANDYVPERINLAVLATRIINEHKRNFIYAGIYPKLKGEAFVYTDEKWCGFIISQLISNAIKYSKSGDNVMFSIEKIGEQIELRITDSGIGIPTEDLLRVFDMYFTGINGRRCKESTGIGLFMAKHIAVRLGIILSIVSEVGKGTTVILTFRNLTQM